MSSRAATSRFAMAAPYAAVRSASPAGTPPSVAAGVGSLAAVRDATDRLIASQRILFIVRPPFCGPGPVHRLLQRTFPRWKVGCLPQAVPIARLAGDGQAISCPG